MATAGWWVTIVMDDTFAGSRHDRGTVVETYFGTLESPPSCPLDSAGTIKRIFVAGTTRPAAKIKRHKLPPGINNNMARAALEALLSNTKKGNAELGPE